MPTKWTLDNIGIYDRVWNTWINPTTMTSANSVIWPIWATTNTATTTTTTFNVQYASVTWDIWNSNFTYREYPTARPTPEERALAERFTEEMRARNQERDRAYHASREEAKRKATALLLDHLDERQRADFEKHQMFTVIDKQGSRHYRVSAERSGHVNEIHPITGKVLRNFCIHPQEDVPNEDNALIAKLMIELDPEEFWRVANVSDHTNGQLYHSGVLPEGIAV